MKKLLAILVAVLALPMAFAVSIGGGVTPVIGTENFAPLIWLCDSRVVYDDYTEPGRFSGGDEELLERINNYAFEGESISWEVLVMDKNGIQKIEDVYGTVDGDIEVNCVEDAGFSSIVEDSCNARILEEDLTGEQIDVHTQRYYTCTLTVETSGSMYGEKWVDIEVTDLDGEVGTIDENEYWFLNPAILLAIEGDLTFENVRPGTDTYSSTLLLGNNADEGSGVMLDMFITGTDFYDSTPSGAACPTSNELELENFRYYVVNGAYSSVDDANVDSAGSVLRDTDAEGYTNIEYGIGFNDPSPFYDDAEILQAQGVGPYWTANLLAPGAEMAITFKLSLPEPCNGDFDTGAIYFWGEAI